MVSALFRNLFRKRSAPPAQDFSPPLPAQHGKLLYRLQLDDQPLRAEFLSLDQLERHGRTLANWHHVASKPGADRLLPRLAENGALIREAYEVVHTAVSNSRPIAPAANWLLDNYYLIENQIRMSRLHLPRKYSQELPQLQGGPADGYPRVYDLAMELISHADGLLDAENLRLFVASYQSVRGLTLGELWAIPIMLRLALIENLRRVSVRVALYQRDRDLAAAWATRVLECLEHDPKNVILVLAELIRTQPRISNSFIAEFTQRLQGRADKTGVALNWLEYHLAERGQTLDQIIALNSQSLAADQVSIGNSITSLRSLGALDWKAFVEQASAIERVLQLDPAKAYGKMAFATRDAYRRAVEEIAKRSPRTEEQVARVAIELAEHPPRETFEASEEFRVRRDPDEPTNHVGFYLVDGGRRLLEQSVGYRPKLVDQVVKFCDKRPLTCYLTAMAVTWAALMLVACIWAAGSTIWWWLPALALAVVATQFSVTIVNWGCTLFVRPRPVHRMDYMHGIPTDCKTLVVVPTMLTNPRDVQGLIDNLELRYLANPDRQLKFALLTDFGDAQTATRPTDEELTDLARAGIERLNARYLEQGANRFYLLHRPRLFNATEKCFMGRERKRGKLEDLNGLLQGGRTDAFSVIVGEVAELANIRYVITLDTDTQIPRDAARLLVACIAHPLNRPRFDPRTRRVVRGHAILQPRVAITLPEANRTLYSRWFAGRAGVDPYTQQISDVYQDVFGEGSFVGKGIYDVAAFKIALDGRFPDNRILSHDLLEGSYLRSGFTNDIELFEGFPSSYLGDMSRRHRWIRGDWQIASWVGPMVPTFRGREPNPLSLLSRWKLFDNLRRSVVTPAALALLAAGWLLTPELAWLWTLLYLTSLFAPILIAALPGFVRLPDEAPLWFHLRTNWLELQRNLAQVMLQLSFLPHEAYCHVDAIVRTLYRLWWRHERMLEWTTASEAERKLAKDLKFHYRTMWSCSAAAALGLLCIAFLSPAAFLPALPFVLLWLAGPWLAWSVTKPLPNVSQVLSTNEQQQLRRLARRTWRYFETFTTEVDNWLIPDNYQEAPELGVAPRTSPTNIGMGLITNLAAHDFGYLSTLRMCKRVEATLGTLDKLERFRGHFYNWYDTRTLKVIEPRYVSAVDSGNMAGLLLVLQVGLEEIQHQLLLRPCLLSGLQDSLKSVIDWSEPVTATARLPKVSRQDLNRRVERMLVEFQALPETLSRTQQWLGQLASTAADLTGSVTALGDPALLARTQAYEAHCRDLLDEFTAIAPWLSAPLPSLDKVEGTARETAQAFVQRIELLDSMPTLSELATRTRKLATEIRAALEANTLPAQQVTLWQELAAGLEAGAEAGSERIRFCQRLAQRCGDFAEMDFTFLYDPHRELLAIGYNASDHRRDASFYDLLASEARLASYIAISQHQLPRDHWFALGRMHTNQTGEPTLLSWSGSMFEYLMPSLIMPVHPETVLDVACRGAVHRQIEYGRQRKVPWGISESCYNLTDASRVYQYRAFGVPGLGLQRGLSNDLVIAPYATAMAAMVEPHEACRNLERLEAVGAYGEYGLVDAVDFTPNRLSASQEPVPCRTYMAHHSGMSFLALDYVLNDRPMQARFLRDPVLRAHDLLLQERVPTVIRPVHPHPTDGPEELAPPPSSGVATTRSFETADTAYPEVHLLSNGNWHVLLTNSGGGYSRWRDLAITRWRADFTRDADGMFCYLRDVRTSRVWSTTYQPVCKPPRKYNAVFSQGRVEYRLVDEDLDVLTAVSVSPEDDVEVRRITLKNLSRTARKIELTTYAEVVLAPPGADAAHRAFSNLFIQTELLPERRAILCMRRPRSPQERPTYAFQLVVVQGQSGSPTSFETDRAKFVGRGRDLQQPASFDQPGPLSNTSGPVLDPILSIRQELDIGAEEMVRVDVVTGAAETREEALALIETYQDHRLSDRAIELAWTHSQIVLQQIGATASDVQLFARLAGPLVHGGPQYRASGAIVSQNKRPQSDLWAYGISGDRPIVLVRVTEIDRLGLVKQLLQAHVFWRLRGLSVDLVIWNDDYTGYRQQLNDEIVALVSAGADAQLIDRPGGVFIRRGDQLSEEDRVLLQSVAQVVLADNWGSLADQLERRLRVEQTLPLLQPRSTRKVEPERDPLPTHRDLLFSNGLGGFTQDGKEYVLQFRTGQSTPAPWCNVLANEQFGTVVSESGLGYTWLENAHEFRLTPWRNDPVCDPVGEAIYVRDEETGRYFSATPLPTRGPGKYVCRHGFGYTVWEYTEPGLSTELWSYVAVDAPVKFFLVKLKNTSNHKRSMSLTGYVEWALGQQREPHSHHTFTEIDPQSGALFARNVFQNEFGSRIAFFQVSEANRSATCDRTEFLGRNGALRAPAALQRTRLAGKAGAGLDPCSALQCYVELAENEEREVVFVLGAAENVAKVQSLLQRFKGVGDARRTLEKVWTHWNQLLGVVHVETPDASLNVLANGWLFYQTLVARFWGRSGFYQSGGAYGFRDQLQDSLALMWAAPGLTREHVLRCASRQFREGDVQHWWHPPGGKGVRTRISDDALWLPYVLARYVKMTGDTGVLDEPIPFLTARPVAADEENFYDQPQLAEETATLYEHCRRAITHAARLGQHGLPLMGGGDWNDGMNLVGAKGRGESVWLGFFLYEVLRQFKTLAAQRGDQEYVTYLTNMADRLKQKLEQEGWDGQWYRRAYFDSGEPLGSMQNVECQIDSIPQSWGVISTAADSERRATAMQQVYERLVDRDGRLIKLFTPPFQRSRQEPGYIKGYLPGVRENGGQYTHAAIWTTIAYALLGDAERAWTCFQLINPVNRTKSLDEVSVYKVEPYVMAADVYSLPPHVGRGGWTWYTGSAGWMQQLIYEHLLGLRLEQGTKLSFAPCVPANWVSYKIQYRYYTTLYRIELTVKGSPTHHVARVLLDGVEQADRTVHLLDDGREHAVQVVLGIV